MSQPLPRLVIAAMRGGAGKTILSLGMAAAWKRRGIPVFPFKKGPDYIDAAWLGRAAGNPCYNLDTYLMGASQVTCSFTRQARPGGISLVEANRGLFDGLDLRGSHSSAELAKLLRAPVVLVVDCRKVTRTAAALVLGCQAFDRDTAIRGVILNRVATRRQEQMLRQVIAASCDLPILGVVPPLEQSCFPERHLGLTPPQEHASVEEALAWIASLAEAHLDLDGLLEVARNAPPWEPSPAPAPRAPGKDVTVGVIRDAAFQFYYPDNLQALEDAGARLVEISAVEAEGLPSLDALYIGGGFPETHAPRISGNRPFREALRRAIAAGLPVYAECGGLLYLGENLVVGGETWPMAGVFPLTFCMERTPQGHGYTLLEVDADNPFYPKGLLLRGHEFHYSRVLHVAGPARTVCQVCRGTGIRDKRDGVCHGNVLALYTHVHAAGAPAWTAGVVGRARGWQARPAAGEG